MGSKVFESVALFGSFGAHVREHVAFEMVSPPTDMVTIWTLKRCWATRVIALKLAVSR